jgi:hypothetical protein
MAVELARSLLIWPRRSLHLGRFRDERPASVDEFEHVEELAKRLSA